jgi:hypothetical protein
VNPEGLQIDQDLEFQVRAWKVERVAWWAMLALVLAGVLGLLGPGPLAKVTTGAPGAPLRLEYQRFERLLTPARLVFRAQPGAGGTLSIWLSTGYLDRVQVTAITPEPHQVSAGSGRVQFLFRIPEPPQPVTVTIHVMPHHFGRLEGEAGMAGGLPLRFRQFVYP